MAKKRVGDIIQWNGKSGRMSGVIRRIEVEYRYIVQVEGSGLDMVITERKDADD